MGRKGVSKRKSPKTKNPVVSTVGTNNMVSSLTRASEPVAIHSAGNGEAASSSKGSKKK